ncbi:hypothetical protein DVH24_037656 [Malus domestica]|uniref:F-actin-capping protein subunit beta n=1 Tax=Malus domestica TaxID=3750 RepID=A0A498J3H6_MALDO|nr:hypothetical protein DVH24_037656 [Malus domestica]
MEAAMALMRRMPPMHTETALSALLSSRSASPGSPLFVLCDMEYGKEFILCEYNRDADSYRSPWSNKYHPLLEDGSLPSLELRKLEVEANDIFAIFRDLGTNKSVRGEMMNMHLSIQEGHICNMGRMIEEMESKLRNSLDQLLCFLTCTLTFLHPALQLRLHNVYFGKTKEMVCTLRPPSEVVMRLPDS